MCIIVIRSTAWKERADRGNRGEPPSIMQQRSTVDSTRCLTNFKMLVSQSMSAVVRQSV